MQGSCYGMPMQLANRPTVDRANRQGGFFKIVSPSYFSTLRLTVTRGRALSERDLQGAPPALVVNERFVKRYLASEDPIGQRVLIQEIVPGKTELGPEIPWEIVGVIRDEKIGGMEDNQSVGVYASNEQSPVYSTTLSVRAAVNPLTLQKSIVDAVHGVNKDQAVVDIRTVDQIKDQSLSGQRLSSTLMTVFGTVALVLAGVGIYGVLSYSVAQRTHEIGIRSALGASRGGILRLVLGRGIVLTTIGLALGLGAALGLTRLMANILFGVGARDPMTIAAVAVVLGAVAVAACYMPARRATNVDPLVALRYE
jgi:putative ABC transport system permease protein